MRGFRAIGVKAGAAALALSAPLAGCGGTRQDAHERSGKFPVSIVSASFPANQRVAQAAKMSIAVRNDGSATVPNVAVTVNSFDFVSQQAGLADPNRPVWIVDAAPQGGQTAYVNTWALGSVAPGQVRTFTWNLTPVLSGHHHIDFRIAAGLNGKARAELSSGGVPQGSFDVNVAGQPAQATVDPASGRVLRAPPAAAGATSGVSGRPAVSHGTLGPNDSQSGSGTGSGSNSGAGQQPNTP